ncbi:MAG: hypothetical protein ACFCUL_14330 [Flavobacteriaceae bacterium]
MNVPLPYLKGVLNLKASIRLVLKPVKEAAEIIPNEPGQVMLPRDVLDQKVFCAG